MENIKFTYYVSPVAQGRPRITTVGGHARAYDPIKSRDFKAMLKQHAQSICIQPLNGALALTVRIYREIPKSFSRKKAMAAENGKIRPITKPDVSNYLKGIEDALNGVLWHDDSQIVAYKEPFGKYYSSTPRIEIEVEQIDLTESEKQ